MNMIGETTRSKRHKHVNVTGQLSAAWELLSPHACMEISNNHHTHAMEISNNHHIHAWKLQIITTRMQWKFQIITTYMLVLAFRTRKQKDYMMLSAANETKILFFVRDSSGEVFSLPTQLPEISGASLGALPLLFNSWFSHKHEAVCNLALGPSSLPTSSVRASHPVGMCGKFAEACHDKF